MLSTGQGQGPVKWCHVMKCIMGVLWQFFTGHLGQRVRWWHSFSHFHIWLQVRSSSGKDIKIWNSKFCFKNLLIVSSFVSELKKVICFDVRHLEMPKLRWKRWRQHLFLFCFAIAQPKISILAWNIVYVLSVRISMLCNQFFFVWKAFCGHLFLKIKTLNFVAKIQKSGKFEIAALQSLQFWTFWPFRLRFTSKLYVLEATGNCLLHSK